MEAEELGGVEHTECADLHAPVDEGAGEPPQGGEGAEGAFEVVGDLKIGFGQDPRGGSLVEGELGDLGGDGGDNLDGACACPDDRDVFVLEIDAVIPIGGVKTRALEDLFSLDSGVGWFIQGACGRDHNAGLVVLSCLGLEIPEA